MAIKLNKIDDQSFELVIELRDKEWKKEYGKAEEYIKDRLDNEDKSTGQRFIRGKKLTKEEEILKKAVEDILFIKIEKAKKDYNLNMINHPNYEILQGNNDMVKISLICINKPKVSLGVYQNLEIDRDYVEVLPSEVDDEMKKYQESDGEIPLIEILPYKYYKDIEEFKQSTKNKLLDEKKYIEERKYINTLMEKIINNSYIDIPESLIRLEASKLHKVFLERMERFAGINHEKTIEMKETWDSVPVEDKDHDKRQAHINDTLINSLMKHTDSSENFIEKYRDKATKTAKVRLVLDKVAEVEEVETKTYTKERLAFFEDEAIYTRDVNALEYLMKVNSKYIK